MTKYYLFIDECGDHGLVNLDINFPVFLLCGILISEENYLLIQNRFNNIKKKFWKEKEVIFHSRDIRKCNSEFQILFDFNIKNEFYKDINTTLENGDYQIISSAINKAKYIETFGKLSNDVYELALSFVMEQTVFCVDGLQKKPTKLEVIIEKRGKKEDKKLDEHFQRLLSRGTNFISSERFNEMATTIVFKSKKENINGLQLADLIAYPTARFVMEPKRSNPAFEIFQNKIYTKNGKTYGLKIFP